MRGWGANNVHWDTIFFVIFQRSQKGGYTGEFWVNALYNDTQSAFTWEFGESGNQIVDATFEKRLPSRNPDRRLVVSF